jgi:hypothetical protein
VCAWRAGGSLLGKVGLGQNDNQSPIFSEFSGRMAMGRQVPPPRPLMPNELPMGWHRPYVRVGPIRDIHGRKLLRFGIQSANIRPDR